MPDISICDNKDCSKFKYCWRAMCIPDAWQSYNVAFKNICNKKNNYQYFYEIGDKPIRKEKLKE